MVCLYDGSFAGLLTLFYRLFNRGEEPTGISSESPVQDDLFAELFESATDPALAARLTRAVADRMGEESLRHLRHAYLSEQPEIEMAIYAYLKLGWRWCRDLDRHLGNVAVARIHRAARRTLHESHRLKGLLRFQETEDGLFYAQVRPEANVLSLLANHFVCRLGDRSWLIHDVRRNLGALFARRKLILGTLQRISAPALAEQEHKWQLLWQTFFEHIAIPERINPQLQRSFMPMKYWEFLVEMQPGKK
ncbi:MAG: TIGR03915 family putative DNA repair protein [Desulfuromonadaceae bacterium]|jgi:probable DNA metabolism protein